MNYDYKNLSPADFEDLVRDLIGRDLNIRFEAFTPGPDQGIDGRHSSGNGNNILQAKHFIGSRFSALKSALKKERTSIDKLSPNRYLLATSYGLTPANKQDLAEIIGPALNCESDIYGQQDLDGLLRNNPDLAKNHIKLWLSGCEILDHIIRAAANTVTTISLAEIDAKVRVYATNPSLKLARDKLEKNHVVIISGPPGVGKSTLAEMLAYVHVVDGWEYHAIRSLDDGFAGLDDRKKQIFFFDDFLGTVALDAHALSSRDSDLIRFVKQVSSSANARFVLTTRTHLFEEARRISDRLGDQKLNIIRYALDVGVYTRRIRARILYNHLYVMRAPVEHFRALWDSGAILKVIDHRNYNPRVVEAMTDALRLQDISAKDYPTVFLDVLDNPSLLWDTTFRHQIPVRCRTLLLSLFFCSEYGCEIDVLHKVFEPLHAYLSEKYGHPRDPKDFNDALKILEGGFLNIGNRRVSFVNPSLRDYLTTYLDDRALLADFARVAENPEWANNVWKFAKVRVTDPQDCAALAGRFAKSIHGLLTDCVWTRARLRPNSLEITGLSISRRLDLLAEWWSHCELLDYANAIQILVQKPPDGFSAWLDGENLVDLLLRLPIPDYYRALPNLPDVLSAIEEGLVELLSHTMSCDDLETVVDKVYKEKDRLSVRLVDAVQNAMAEHVKNIEDVIESIDSETELEEQIIVLDSRRKEPMGQGFWG